MIHGRMKYLEGVGQATNVVVCLDGSTGSLVRDTLNARYGSVSAAKLQCPSQLTHRDRAVVHVNIALEQRDTGELTVPCKNQTTGPALGVCLASSSMRRASFWNRSMTRFELGGPNLLVAVGRTYRWLR